MWQMLKKTKIRKCLLALAVESSLVILEPPWWVLRGKRGGLKSELGARSGRADVGSWLRARLGKVEEP